MKPAPFAYHRPGTVTEAVAALAGDPGAKVLAGGQSLVPLLSMRLAAPSALVDLNGIPGLDSIDVDDAGRADRGAGPARGRARLRGRTPRAAAGLPGAGQRRARHDPQPRHDRRLARARRRRRRDAGRAHPARRLAGRGGARAAGARSRRPSSTSARSSRRSTTTRSRCRRSSRLWRPAPGWRSRRSPGGTATTRWSAPPRWSRASPSRSATCPCPTSRPWSTCPGWPTTTSATRRWSTSSQGTTSTRPRRTVPNSSAC